MANSNRPKKKDDTFFTKKKRFVENSWDFDGEDLELPKGRSDSQKKLNLGDKIEIGIYNFGEFTEKKTAKLKKNIKKHNNPHEANASHIVDKMIPPRLMSWAIKIILAIYSVIGVFCLTLLVLFCVAYLASYQYQYGSSFFKLFLYIIIGIITFGALFGMYATFKFGEIDEQLLELKEHNRQLDEQVKSVAADGDNLASSINAFSAQVDVIMDNESDLKSQIKAFNRLENELKAEARSNNKEIVQFLQDVQLLFREFKALQITVEKANLLQLFYEIELRDDGSDGLNKNEYEIFMARLDPETAQKFKSFREMDRNGDGNIDIDEFQTELNRIYDRLDLVVSKKGRKNAKKKQKKSKNKDWDKWLK